jgi:hypothetical protein
MEAEDPCHRPDGFDKYEFECGSVESVCKFPQRE